MGTLPGVKLASIEWVGPLDCNSAHSGSPRSSASPGKPCCLPGTVRREDASPSGQRQEVGARIWETEVRTKPPWLQLLLSVPAASAGWRRLPTPKQRQLLGKPAATLECQ